MKVEIISKGDSGCFAITQQKSGNRRLPRAELHYGQETAIPENSRGDTHLWEQVKITGLTAAQLIDLRDQINATLDLPLIKAEADSVEIDAEWRENCEEIEADAARRGQASPRD